MGEGALSELPPQLVKYFDPQTQGALIANRWGGSDQNFDDAYIAQVASRDPAFAKKLLELRQNRLSTQIKNYLGNMFSPQTPGVNPMLPGINGAIVPNPRPALMYPPAIGARG